MIRLALIHEGEITPAATPEILFRCYRISDCTLSEQDIISSAFSSPARFVEEMFLRTRKQDGAAARSSTCVVNPLFALDRLALFWALRVLPSLGDDEVVVLSDRKNRPLAYFLPTFIETGEARFLQFLSCVDARLDARLLGLVFSVPARHLALPQISINRARYNGFAFENESIFAWTAERACTLMASRLRRQGLDPDALSAGQRQVARDVRDALPCRILMPYHAGDALFFALAWNAVRPWPKQLVICAAYADIIAAVAPELEVHASRVPANNRNGEPESGISVREHTWFETFKNSLPEDALYLWIRPSRNYNSTLFHLIDHYAFALGEACLAPQTLVTHRKTGPVRRESRGGRYRILLHFDGGWPMKVYPPAQQEVLIDLLHAAGHEITVLAASGAQHDKCTVTPFQGLSWFRKLLNEHDMLVGMDSFPAHFATHVVGMPTLCLFASTRPLNSDTLPSHRYRALEQGLACRPCYSLVECRKYGGRECLNFVPPRFVADQVVTMLERVYRSLSPCEQLPVARLPLNMADGRVAVRCRKHRNSAPIWRVDHLDWRIRLARFVQFLSHPAEGLAALLQTQDDT